jgi:hypothetical protein
VRFLYVTALAMLAVLAVGCDQKKGWDLVTTKDGFVYRINKQTGDVSLIAGTQAAKVEETTSFKKDDAQTNHVVVWPAQQNKQLGDLKITMKTNWRDGKLYYIFQVSPFAGRIESELQKSPSYARFIVRLYDQDGFELMTIPVSLSDMVKTVDDTGKAASLYVNTTVTCSFETYSALYSWGVGWAGFQD